MSDFSLGPWDPSADTLPNMFETGISFSAGQVAQAPNTLWTVPSNALQSMTPVSDAGAESWSGFWQDLTKGAIGYAITRDAVRNGITPQRMQPAPVAPTAPAGVPRANQASVSPLMLLVLGGLAFAVVRS